MTETDPELLSVKIRKASLLKRKLELVKAFGLAYYRPHSGQDAFHRAGVKFRRRMIRTGNRWGKSIAGCAEDCAWMMNERSWYPESDPARRGGIPQHPVKMLTITTDWDKVDEIFTSQVGEGGKVWKFLPKDFIKSTKRNHSGCIDTIVGKNQSVWRFDTVKSFMSNPQSSESSDWDFIHIDEPCPEDMWKGVSRGLMDRNGSAIFTLTPLREFWINDYFFPQDTGGSLRDDVWALTGSTYDNPYLPTEAVKEFEQSLSEGERECRILGIPLHLSGLVYKEFQFHRHVLTSVPAGWKSYSEPPLDYSIYYAIDPHPQTPHAILFCAVSPLGQRFYYHDIFNHCSVETLSTLIRSHIGSRNVCGIKIDPLAYINDPITESNMAEEFIRCGIFVDKATKALEQGILRVQGELKRDPGQIFFTPAARRSLWEIQRYCWDEKENKPVDKDDHMMENLYRLELLEPRYIPLASRLSIPINDIEINRPELDLETVGFAI